MPWISNSVCLFFTKDAVRVSQANYYSCHTFLQIPRIETKMRISAWHKQQNCKPSSKAQCCREFLWFEILNNFSPSALYSSQFSPMIGNWIWMRETNFVSVPFGFFNFNSSCLKWIQTTSCLMTSFADFKCLWIIFPLLSRRLISRIIETPQKTTYHKPCCLGSRIPASSAIGRSWETRIALAIPPLCRWGCPSVECSWSRHLPNCRFHLVWWESKPMIEYVCIYDYFWTQSTVQLGRIRRRPQIDGGKIHANLAT
jgi:hypothetical protein